MARLGAPLSVPRASERSPPSAVARAVALQLPATGRLSRPSALRKRPRSAPRPVKESAVHSGQRMGRHPTLATLLRELVGSRVVVELRDETEVRGRLDDVDASMRFDSARGIASERIAALLRRPLTRAAPARMCACALTCSMRLSGVKWKPLQRPVVDLERVFLQGTHVRFVHLPDSLDVTAALERQERASASARRRGPPLQRPRKKARTS